ncbi:MAG TPA: DUF2461 domain-containing protein [Phenylobacterium sp.]
MDAPFLGFPDTQAFLAELKANNERGWFQANKARYERVMKGPAEAFAAELRPRLEALAERPVGAKIFRIHRDVRFSKDKSPYNAHLHIALRPDTAPGEIRRRGVFYFGLEADRLTLGVGAFDFGPADLEKYRRAVAGDSDGEELVQILSKMEAKPGEPDLKRVPAPYPADHPRGDLLRRKGLNVWQDLYDAELIASPDLVDEVMAVFEQQDPVNLWLTEVLEER